METTHQPSNNVELNDRVLWFDGSSTYPADVIHTKPYHAGLTFVDKVTREVQKYNQFVDSDKRLNVKQDVGSFHFDWNIPETYRELDVVVYIVEKLQQEIEANDFTNEQIEQRTIRVAEELALYEKLALNNVLRVLIFIINSLTKNRVVWGVGRGSSVSSYVLYLIGVHDVDSVLYELDIADFLH